MCMSEPECQRVLDTCPVHQPTPAGVFVRTKYSQLDNNWMNRNVFVCVSSVRGLSVVLSVFYKLLCLKKNKS